VEHVRLGYQERQAVLALSGGIEMSVKLLVTEAERELIRQAAKDNGVSVGEWLSVIAAHEARLAEEMR
jgi:hypothetical protein